MKLHRSALAGVLAIALGLAATPASAKEPALAPLGDAGKDRVVPGRYIVMLKKSAGAGIAAGTVAALAASRGGNVLARYSHVFQGFAADLPARALEAVRANPAVAWVEPDSVVEGTTDQVSPPSWGLDRIDQRVPPLNNVYTYDSTGAGVTAFVIDSGIRETHVDFGGRALGVFDAIGDGMGTQDCNGHGTHVAATLGGETFGVAKGVQIRAVRTLNCDNTGLSSDTIESMDWVAANHPARSVVNISIRSSNPASRVALEGLINSGVHAAVGASNDSGDACLHQKLYSPLAVMVGASTIFDSIASFSNTGPCVDVFAPGVDIISASHLSDTGSTSKNGTSMATPHAAGWMARYLEENPTATTAQSKAALVGSATQGFLFTPQDTANRLLWADPANTPPDTTPPSAPATLVKDLFDPITGVQVSWAAATDDTAVAGYNVYQEAGAQDILVLYLPRFTTVTLEIVWESTRVFYVTAVDTSGNESAASPTLSVTIGPSPCRVTYDAGGGGTSFTANLSIKNTGTASITFWTLEFAFPADQQLIPEQTWNANWTQVGQTVFASNLPWNATINVGESVFIGFNGTHTGSNPEPDTFRFNGFVCQIS
jgi:subtilisin family serine protease